MSANTTAGRDVERRSSERDISYWVDRLAGFVPLDLPVDRSATASDGCDAVACRRLPTGLVAAVRNAARSSGFPTSTTLLTAFVGLLARYTDQYDLIVATTAAPAAGPAPLGEPVMLRVDASGGPSLPDLLGRVHAAAAEAAAHALPFDDLVQEIGRQGGPPIRVLFLDDEDRCPTGDVVLGVRVGGGGARIDARYSSGLFDPETIDELLAAYESLLTAWLADPGCPLDGLPLMFPADAARMLMAQNDTEQSLPHGQRLQDPFEQHAARFPDSVAAVSPGGRYTFGELDATANRIACELRELGVGRETRVAVCLPRGVELICATLAVLKAGGAFVPVDPGYPAVRIEHMLSDSEARVVVTRSDALLPGLKVPATVPVLTLDDAAERIGMRQSDPVRCPAQPDDLCYVIYTSGSSGVPKGIGLRHRGVVNNLLDLNRRFDVGPGDVVLALSSQSFDMSVYEIIGVPGAGGTVVLPDVSRGLDPADWLALITEHTVSVWNTVPTLLTLLLDEWEAGGGPAPASLRLALLGGDWIPVGLPDRLRTAAPGVRMVSLGGATEASIHSTLYEIGAVDPRWTSIPYGRPMANQLAVVLDDALNPVPVGVPGNLYLGGIGLARGYIGIAEAANSRFLVRELPGLGRQRLYLTGDRARWRRTGQLELIGRLDAQVKLNGVRVELGEVEAALSSVPGVRASAATVFRGPRGDQVLVGYVVADPADVLETEQVRSALVDRLPVAMRPGSIVRLDTLPLSPNGKVDRRSLPLPDDLATAPPTDPETGAGEPPGPSVLTPVTRMAAALAAAFAHRGAGLTTGAPGQPALLRSVRSTADRSHTLICFPAEGSAWDSYQPLADALPSGLDLWAVDLPRHRPDDDRPLAPLQPFLRACADEVARRVTGPVAIMGHGAGAAAAVALARELTADGRLVTATFLVAALPDPDPFATTSEIMEDQWLLDRLRSTGRCDHLCKDGDDDGAVLALVRHDLLEAARFFVREELGQGRPVRLEGPLHVIVGEADPTTPDAGVRYRAWGAFADVVSFASIPGADHYLVNRQPAVIARILAAELLPGE